MSIAAEQVAKHYRPDPPVGRGPVQQLVAGMLAEEASLGWVVTSGSYSEEALDEKGRLEEGHGLRIELIDGDQLASMIVEGGLKPSSQRAQISADAPPPSTTFRDHPHVAPAGAGDRRTSQLRDLLVEAARSERVLHYGDISPRFGLHMDNPRHRHELSELLKVVSRTEVAEGRPTLSSGVVQREGSTPGKGLYKLGQELRVVRAGEDEMAFSVRQLRGTFEYWPHH